MQHNDKFQSNVYSRTLEDIVQIHCATCEFHQSAHTHTAQEFIPESGIKPYWGQQHKRKQQQRFFYLFNHRAHVHLKPLLLGNTMQLANPETHNVPAVSESFQCTVGGALFTSYPYMLDKSACTEAGPPVPTDAHILHECIHCRRVGKLCTYVHYACEQCHQLLWVEAPWSPASMRGGTSQHNKGCELNLGTWSPDMLKGHYQCMNVDGTTCSHCSLKYCTQAVSSARDDCITLVKGDSLCSVGGIICAGRVASSGDVFHQLQLYWTLSIGVEMRVVKSPSSSFIHIRETARRTYKPPQSQSGVSLYFLCLHFVPYPEVLSRQTDGEKIGVIVADHCIIHACAMAPRSVLMVCHLYKPGNATNINITVGRRVAAVANISQSPVDTEKFARRTWGWMDVTVMSKQSRGLSHKDQSSDTSAHPPDSATRDKDMRGRWDPVVCTGISSWLTSRGMKQQQTRTYTRTNIITGCAGVFHAAFSGVPYSEGDFADEVGFMKVRVSHVKCFLKSAFLCLPRFAPNMPESLCEFQMSWQQHDSSLKPTQLSSLMSSWLPEGQQSISIWVKAQAVSRSFLSPHWDANVSLRVANSSYCKNPLSPLTSLKLPLFPTIDPSNSPDVECLTVMRIVGKDKDHLSEMRIEQLRDNSLLEKERKTVEEQRSEGGSPETNSMSKTAEDRRGEDVLTPGTNPEKNEKIEKKSEDETTTTGNIEKTLARNKEYEKVSEEKLIPIGGETKTEGYSADVVRERRNDGLDLVPNSKRQTHDESRMVKPLMTDKEQEEGKYETDVKFRKIDQLKQTILEMEKERELVAGIHLHNMTTGDNHENEKMLTVKQEIVEENKEREERVSSRPGSVPSPAASVVSAEVRSVYKEVLQRNHLKRNKMEVKVNPHIEDVIVKHILLKPPQKEPQTTHRAQEINTIVQPNRSKPPPRVRGAKPKPQESKFKAKDVKTKDPNPTRKAKENKFSAQPVKLTHKTNTTQPIGKPKTHKMTENGKRNKPSAKTALVRPTKNKRVLNKTVKKSEEYKGKRDKAQKSSEKKKEVITPTSMHFPYFLDNYCPPECACYGRVVQCSDKGIDTIPYGIPYNSRYILLMNNHIRSIQLDLLSEYVSMDFLVLSNNKLTDDAIEGAFEGVLALKRLYLDTNLLENVPTDLPVSLEELRLDNNRLSVISEAAWAQCPSLLVLSLSNNSLGNVSESLPSAVLSPLGKLRTLNLNHNQLTSVPLGLPLSMKELYLKGNLIEKFHAGVFNGRSELLLLDLSANRLTDKGLVRDSLLNATHLESLNFAGNRLKKVPCHLPHSLKILNLEGNLITSIKKAAFSTLTSLEHLGLAKNKIFRVAPGAFRTLLVLHHLDLCHNTLRQVPRQLPQTLHSVVLTHNKIQSVPRDAFCWDNSSLSLSRLVRVQLEHNLIDMGKLDVDAFRCLRGFQVVHFY
ncbi:Podocan Precursor [Channa argus]|uniref:Podocan n=1 Tax=Channa argus TaxID=215402 RepID=A0A6G1QRI7_CHAAH|nr:Podocan Precursor [Channa argus]